MSPAASSAAYAARTPMWPWKKLRTNASGLVSIIPGSSQTCQAKTLSLRSKIRRTAQTQME